MGEGVVICPYVHNMAGHVDECRQCDVWKDSRLGFLDQADDDLSLLRPDP
jgi:hypothetical protein